MKNVIFKLQGPIHAPVLMVVINKPCVSRLLYLNVIIHFFPHLKTKDLDHHRIKYIHFMTTLNVFDNCNSTSKPKTFKLKISANVKSYVFVLS